MPYGQKLALIMLATLPDALRARISILLPRSGSGNVFSKSKRSRFPVGDTDIVCHVALWDKLQQLNSHHNPQIITPL